MVKVKATTDYSVYFINEILQLALEDIVCMVDTNLDTDTYKSTMVKPVMYQR